MAILACFLLILIPYASSISFNFTNITLSYRDKFRFEGGSNISEDGIQVTQDYGSGLVTTGEVTYMEQLHLWDRSSGELASFSTSFSFVKLFNSTDQREDDGLKFFLAEKSSVVDGVDDSNGQFVWVEFDPYCNPWDNNPICDHVGINVNSPNSVENQPWRYDESTKRECQVRIEYDSASQILSVSFTGLRNKTVEEDRVAHRVDLRKELPERVYLGFSAATAGVFDRNTVKSWTFNSSNLQLDENKLVLVVGLIVGISVLITLGVMLAFIFLEEEEKQ